MRVTIESISILPCMYQSTIFGKSVRPDALPRAFQPPNPSCEQLRDSRADLCGDGGHTNDNTFAPAFFRKLQGCAHHVHVVSSVKGIIRAPASAFDKVGHQIVISIGWIYKVGNSKLRSHISLGVIQVHTENLICACKANVLKKV